MDGTELIYVGDPMCSWCWGFVPVLDGLVERLGLPLKVVVGGLSPGEAAQEVDDGLAATLAHHWEQVQERSGQPFDQGLLERRGWRYDTELACVSVVAVRERWPELAMPWFARLQRAFYAEGVDITAIEAYPALAQELLPDHEALVAAMESEETRTQAWQDFAWSHKLGIRGFPTLLVHHGGQLTLATQGWMPLEPLAAGLERWLREQGAAG